MSDKRRKLDLPEGFMEVESAIKVIEPEDAVDYLRKEGRSEEYINKYLAIVDKALNEPDDHPIPTFRSQEQGA